MRLGSSEDGRVLEYDQRRYAFSLDGEPVAYAYVRALDNKALIRWRALEQRDWFRRLNADDLEACRKRALAESAAQRSGQLSPEQQVLADAARDDGVLAGKLVDADPALVQAVADELAKRGFGAKASQDEPNPLASMSLPRGMEALGQMERTQNGKRDMTRQEKRLMKRILKNDDKAKSKREKEAARSGAASGQPAQTDTSQADSTASADSD